MRQDPSLPAVPSPASRRVVGALILVVGVAITLTVAVLVLLATSAPGQTPAPSGLVREPYLAGARPTSILVGWKTETPTTGVIRFGLGDRLDRSVESPPGTHHLVRLSGLEPDSRYRYQVEVDGTPLAAASFRTLPASAEVGFRLAVIGDFGAGTDAQTAVAERIRSEGAQLIVTTGDNAYDTGSETDLDLRVFPQIGELLGSVPIIASLGNHDVATDGGAPSRRAFGIPATGYHSFDAGPVHFLVLDSNDRCLARGCPQTEWLMADLADAARPFVFVFFHSTVSSCGRHGTDTTLREAWHPLFAAAGVDVVFMGHDHGYQRSVPTDGVLYVTTGGGGADLYTWSDDCPIAAVVADATTDGGAHHALIVDVEAERATIRAVRGSDGFVLDEVALAP